MTFVWRHPKFYKKSKDNLTNELNYDKGNHDEKIQSKTSRTRNRSSSDNTIRKEPTIEKLENNIAYYLNHNLMKIEANDFYAVDRYFITYEEVALEL